MIKMKAIVLGSGSSGNSTYIEINNIKILIDIGFSYRSLKEKLKTISVFPKDIDYIFITHEHTDHTFGLCSFLKNNNPVVYIDDSIKDICLKDLNYENIKNIEEEIIINNVLIRKVPTSHDSLFSCGFLIQDDHESIVYITDTGYINTRLFKIIQNKKYYILESNHDVEMLLHGHYPLYLQRRILSDKGHLSNESCGEYLSRIVGPNTKKIVLAHLSEHNNKPDLALETVKHILANNNIDNIETTCATQKEIECVTV